MTPTSPSISTALDAVLQRIQTATTAAHRSPNSVQLLAVSKTFQAEKIREAYTANQRAFGENYVQEGIEKITALNDLRSEIEWHFIGPLQSNKTKLVAQHFDWVHSIDRIKIAERLNEQRPSHLQPLNVCIQINISKELSKNGIYPEELEAFIQGISPLTRLRLRGLMAIPEPTPLDNTSHASFQAMHELFNTINRRFTVLNLPTPLDCLSMGMSADLETAIAHGSTLVRVGSAIFGSRTYENK
jgi:PLP dependent protein